MGMLAYRRMTREELDSRALLAAEAFYNYEYFSIYIPDDARRRQCLNAMIKTEFRANWNNPEVTFFTALEDGSPVAVAQLCSPDFKKPSDVAYIRCGWLGVMRKGGIRQVNAWNDMEKLASAPCHTIPGKNWYLSLLTVARTDEGKGIGSRFLDEFLIPYAKEAGGETFSLFTNSESNRRFYEKNGFDLFDEKRFEYGGKTIGSWSYSMKL